MKCTLDKLSLLGNIRSRTRLENFVNNHPYMKGRALGKWPYRHNFYMVDGTILQLAEIGREITIPQARVEFNPNQAMDGPLMELLENLESMRPTRVDVAVDYKQDLAEYNWHKYGVKRCIWYDEQCRPETIYLGAPSSEHRIRIYNKALEQKMPDKAPWWRVEQQSRLKEGQSMADPFEGLHAVIQPPGDLSANDRAVSHYFMAGCDVSGFDKKTRKKYRDIIAQAPARLDPTPQEVWEQEKARINTQIIRYTGMLLPERSDYYGQ
jgi:hypothetical protein